jgi:ABC-type transport system substrate-binding protein
VDRGRRRAFERQDEAPDPVRSRRREALNLLADRGSIQQHIYGRTGFATRNFLTSPERFRSSNTKWEFNIDKANQVLDAAGWKRGADGIRAKDGKRIRFVFHTTINAPRQKTQQIIAGMPAGGHRRGAPGAHGFGLLLLGPRES